MTIGICTKDYAFQTGALKIMPEVVSMWLSNLKPRYGKQMSQISRKGWASRFLEDIGELVGPRKIQRKTNRIIMWKMRSDVFDGARVKHKANQMSESSS